MPPWIPAWRTVALVGAGGGAGALARVWLSATFPSGAGQMPWTTLLENASGAFLLAFLLTMLVDRAPSVAWLRPLLGTGLLGAYTTFATLGLELHLLAAGGRLWVAWTYLAATAMVGLASGGLGLLAGRALEGRRR